MPRGEAVGHGWRVTVTTARNEIDTTTFFHDDGRTIVVTSYRDFVTNIVSDLPVVWRTSTYGELSVRDVFERFGLGYVVADAGDKMRPYCQILDDAEATPEELIHVAATTRDRQIFRRIIRHPSVNLDVFNAILQHSVHHYWHHVKDPHLLHTFVTSLEKSHYPVLISAAQNRNVLPETLRFIAQASPRSGIAYQHPNIPEDVIIASVQRGEKHAQYLKESWTHLSPEVMAVVASSPHWNVRIVAARHPATPVEALASMYYDRSAPIRALVQKRIDVVALLSV